MIESLIFLTLFIIGVLIIAKLDELRMRRRSHRRLREFQYRQQFFRNYEEARRRL